MISHMQTLIFSTNQAYAGFLLKHFIGLCTLIMYSSRYIIQTVNFQKLVFLDVVLNVICHKSFGKLSRHISLLIVSFKVAKCEKEQ